jgi:hypothetical protein
VYTNACHTSFRQKPTGGWRRQGACGRPVHGVSPSADSTAVFTWRTCWHVNRSRKDSRANWRSQTTARLLSSNEIAWKQFCHELNDLHHSKIWQLATCRCLLPRIT